MDLSEFNLEEDSEKGASFQLRHPQIAGMLLPVYFWVVGPDSKTARRAITDLMRRSKPDMTDEEANILASKATAAIVTKWEGVKWEGVSLDFTREKAEMVFTKQPWIRQQVEQFAGNRVNFFRGSLTDLDQR